MKKMILFLFLFIFQVMSAQSSKEIDSLSNILSSTTNDSVKISVLNKLALAYAYNDKNKAKTLLKKAEKLAHSGDITYGYNEVIFLKGAFCIIAGNPDSAYYYCKKAFDLSRKNKFKPIEVRSINAFGMIEWNRGNFDKALNYFFKALQLNESIPPENKIEESLFYNNIGLIYNEKRLYKKGLYYYSKAYEIRVKKNLLREQGVSLNNLGICYTNLKDTNKALKSFEDGIIIANKANDKVTYFKIVHNLANLYADNLKYEKAIQLYLTILNNPNDFNSNPRDLVILYGCISNTYNKINKHSEALKYSKKGLAIIEKDTLLNKYADNIYNSLTKSYFHSGDIEKGDYYLTKHYNLLKDLFSETSSSALAEMEIKYQTEKKEKELLKVKAAVAVRELEIKKKNTQFVILALIVSGLLIISFLIYRQQKLKITQQKEEFKLKSAISKIETQNKLQEQRLDISRDLHDNIGAQLTFIISSVDNIKYAFDIKNTNLDNKLSGISNFAKATIVELRDTIWAMNKNEITFEDLQSRIHNFIENAKEAKDTIKLVFSIDDNLKNIKLTSIEGMNIYRTIQEAINNSFKYANANQIIIDAKKEKNTIQITIEDDGIGFDEKTVKKGNGLLNMQQRIEAIGGEFNLHSESGKGTIITLLLKKYGKNSYS